MIIRQYILLSGLLFSAFASFAQAEKEVYYRNGRIIINKDSADTYRVIDSREGDNFRFTEYHTDGTFIKALGKGHINRPVYLGNRVFYYKDGKMAIKEEYDNGRLLKTWRFYPNGVLMQVTSTINSIPNTPVSTILVNYDADSLGRVHIANGNGIRQETDTLKSFNIREQYTMTGPYKNGLKDGLWKGTDNRGFEFEETYDAGKLISGTTKTTAGKKYHYTNLYEYPQFNGDIDKVESRVIPYLKNTADTTGLRFFKPNLLRLSYIINEDGRIIDIKGFKKLANAPIPLQLKSELPKCDPARLRGVPISYTITSNTDYMVRHDFLFTPFQTDVWINGTYAPKQ